MLLGLLRLESSFNVFSLPFGPPITASCLLSMQTASERPPSPHALVRACICGCPQTSQCECKEAAPV